MSEESDNKFAQGLYIEYSGILYIGLTGSFPEQKKNRFFGMNFLNQVIWAQKLKNREFLAQKIERSQFLDFIFRNPMYRIPLF